MNYTIGLSYQNKYLLLNC